jgi:hypothetical protein
METITRGVVMPRISAADVEIMAHKNPSIVHALAKFIWDMSDLDQQEIEEAVADTTRDIVSAGAGAAGTGAS